MFRDFYMKIMLTFFAFLCFAPFISIKTQAEEPRTVRVGYHEEGDYMNKNVEGEYEGFSFEYLYSLLNYANWKYEIVDCSSWEDMYQKLLAGEIDMIPCAYYTEERNQEISYAELPICEIYSTLSVRSGDDRFDFEDFAAFSSMKVGVIRGTKDFQHFKEYCERHGITAQIIEYSETPELFNALRNGELDAAASSYMGRQSEFGSVAHFSPEHLYTVVSKDNEALCAELDDALEALKLGNPNFGNQLYSKYFSVGSGQAPIFTKSEKEFIAEADTIQVICEPDWAPLEYIDEKTGTFRGICVDIFGVISAATGLEFEFVAKAGSSAHPASNDSTQILCAVNSDYQKNGKNHIKVTRKYLEIPVALVKRDVEKEVQKIGISENRFQVNEMIEDNPGKTILYYPSTHASFDALLSGEVDAVYANTYVTDYLRANETYEEFAIPHLTAYMDEICVGMSEYSDPRLFSVIDKSLQFISRETTNEIVIRNTAIPKQKTLRSIIKQNPASVVGGLIVVFLLITTALLHALAVKSRNANRMEKLLYRDALTNLWNLKRFCMEAEKQLKTKAGQPYAFVYIDFNQFRMVNDVFGFSEGDWLLCSFADILRDSVDGEELCARISADQFVLLLKYQDWNHISARTKQIDKAINEKIRQEGKTYRLTIIFGVYLVEKELHQDVSTMLDLANYARRNAKTGSHKSVAVLYDEQMRYEELAHRELEERMVEALDSGEFIPYFQPKVDMLTGQIVGSEALARWNHPTKGMVMPGTFIPIFEQNRFVLELDMYIYEQVCSVISDARAAGRTIGTISCNFSRLHFKREDFPEKLKEIADRYRVPYECIELEVTENVAMENPDQVLEQVNRLKEIGFQIDIDDFGSGYSSLGLLESMPVDVIKLDRSFLHKSMCGKRGESIIRGVVQIAQELNMHIVCEGVETKEQVEFLISNGCYTAQGFYYSKPLPLKEFERQLQIRGVVDKSAKM